MTQTRCPSCQTAFRVTPEQLLARGGKVRCGACQQIFNAGDYLLDAENPETKNLHFPRIQPEMTPKSTPLTPPQTPPPLSEAQLTSFDDPDTTRAPEPIIDPVVDPIDAALAQQDDEDAVFRSEISSLSPQEIRQLGREAGLVAPRDLTEVPGFSKWSDGIAGTPARTYALWPFVLASVILALLLAAQLLYHYRGELARGKPGVQAAFSAFGIEIPLPREAERISIDASELRPVTEGDSDDPAAHSGRLQLTTTLKNQASYPQEWPHLEIALTDIYDTVLTRKVFKPDEYLPADAPSAFAPGETLVTLALSVGELQPSGYRLNLLYP
ncbi:MAG: zinc-ribbon domain-containing protein [Zoogloeaceae bacterium]|jgi:predicted Zn finger-like uncharacterized protein|nr:zinc-ribbon domain-containing protein [Zoogloeaceae bacterium]